ncbi:MAG: hypothetical protein WCJ23_03080 [Verrucomicrobiota bacterium]
MNKPLLLILCDFLLLNLLALTRWDKNDLPPPPLALASQPTSAREDVVAALRLTLEEERANREKLARDLTSTQAESTTRANILDQARARTTELSERLQKKEQELQRQLKSAEAEVKQQLNHRKATALWTPIVKAITRLLFSKEEIEKYNNEIEKLAEAGKTTNETIAECAWHPSDFLSPALGEVPP